MPNLDQNLEANLSQLRQYNQLASPTQAQTNMIVKLLVQCVAMLIFARINHPDDTP